LLFADPGVSYEVYSETASVECSQSAPRKQKARRAGRAFA
jgi:hypothetical protein